MKSWENIFEIESETSFKKKAIEIYHFQKSNNPVYGEYIDMLGRKDPVELHEIPFLPIELFKTRKVYSSSIEEELVFKSSGTGGDRSVHFIADRAIYELSFTKAYNQFIGNPKDQVILALLPNYLEQGNSSLIYMVNHLIRQTGSQLSGFVLKDPSQLVAKYQQAIEAGKSVIIIGVSYALLDLAAQQVDLANAVIIETGGMKGKRKELSKHELHTVLKKGLNPSKLMSEYGMTELLSQAYCSADLRFNCPDWMKIMIRDVNDPFNYVEDGKTGGINVIDLANVYSCSFIATQDLGKMHQNGFEVMGRFDQSDIRGCNLLVQ